MGLDWAPQIVDYSLYPASHPASGLWAINPACPQTPLPSGLPCACLRWSIGRQWRPVGNLYGDDTAEVACLRYLYDTEEYDLARAVRREDGTAIQIYPGDGGCMVLPEYRRDAAQYAHRQYELLLTCVAGRESRRMLARLSGLSHDRVQERMKWYGLFHPVVTRPEPAPRRAWPSLTW